MPGPQEQANVISIGTPFGENSALMALLGAGDIVPGAQPSYQTCKIIYTNHPLGGKMADGPIEIAQSQPREITVQRGPQDKLKEAFERQWEADGHDGNAANVCGLARVYGIASLGLIVGGESVDTPIDFDTLYDKAISFSVWDPLNTAGSLVLNQDPNAVDYQKIEGIRVNGKSYHRSRTCTIMNEKPVYIEYTNSAFGYVGRSVYQRPLFPLKSFVQTMITDDVVVVKVGVLVAKIKGAGPISDRLQQFFGGIKRLFIKEARTGQVIQITPDDEIASLDFTNFAPPYELTRKNILDNIATGGGMPAILLNQETFAEGFSDGTEDSKRVAQYIKRVREWMGPVYKWLDEINMHRAWNPDWYAAEIQANFSEYKDVDYKTAFYQFKNSYKPVWPNLIEEPDSEKIKVDDVKLKAVIAVVEVMAPMLPSEAKLELIEWCCDCFNSNKLLFSSPLILELDADDLEEMAQQALDATGETEGEPGAKNKPFSAADSTGLPDPERLKRALAGMSEAMGAITEFDKWKREKRSRREMLKAIASGQTKALESV